MHFFQHPVGYQLLHNTKRNIDKYYFNCNVNNLYSVTTCPVLLISFVTTSPNLLCMYTKFCTCHDTRNVNKCISTQPFSPLFYSTSPRVCISKWCFTVVSIFCPTPVCMRLRTHVRSVRSAGSAVGQGPDCGFMWPAGGNDLLLSLGVCPITRGPKLYWHSFDRHVCHPVNLEDTKAAVLFLWQASLPCFLALPPSSHPLLTVKGKNMQW